MPTHLRQLMHEQEKPYGISILDRVRMLPPCRTPLEASNTSPSQPVMISSPSRFRINLGLSETLSRPKTCGKSLNRLYGQHLQDSKIELLFFRNCYSGYSAAQLGRDGGRISS